jgi:hypothetical protein
VQCPPPGSNMDNRRSRSPRLPAGELRRGRAAGTTRKSHRPARPREGKQNRVRQRHEPSVTPHTSTTSHGLTPVFNESRLPASGRPSGGSLHVLSVLAKGLPRLSRPAFEVPACLTPRLRLSGIRGWDFRQFAVPRARVGLLRDSQSVIEEASSLLRVPGRREQLPPRLGSRAAARLTLPRIRVGVPGTHGLPA